MTETDLELLTDIDVLVIVEKGITDRICHVVHEHANTNNKNMKHYDEN